MKIAVDCRMIDSSGIGVYLQNILAHWIQRKNITFVLIGNKEKIDGYIAENCILVNFTASPFTIEELFRFPISAVNDCDVFYSPNYNIPIGIKIPIVTTIHDVLFLDHKGIVSSFGKLLRTAYLKWSFKKSSAVVTVSEFSKKRIIFHCGAYKDIKVVYNGISSSLLQFARNGTTINRYNFPYIVFVGNIKKHKGLDVLLEAFKLTKKEHSDLHLVIVGQRDNFKSVDIAIVNEFSNNRSDIHFTGHVDDHSLYNIIIDANALIQPSRYEGFGIPPLEAISLHTQPIISDIPVFREIYSKLPVIFFKKDDPEDLKCKILKFASVKQKVDVPEEFRNIYDYKVTAEKCISFVMSKAK